MTRHGSSAAAWAGDPESEVAVWIALRRAHQGGVAKLGDQWLDSGRPVPGYVADALNGLTQTGLLALTDADPESGGMRRARVTDSGCARYVALCQVHKPRGAAVVGTPRRWALSPYDQRSHLLVERGSDSVGVLVAVCGQRMPWSTDISARLTGRGCPTCEALTVMPPAPQFGNPPDSGWPPVERFLPSPLTPGGRPDTTEPARQVVTSPCIQLPMVRVDSLVTGVRVPDPQFPHKIPAGCCVLSASCSMTTENAVLDPTPMRAACLVAGGVQ